MGDRLSTISMWAYIIYVLATKQGNAWMHDNSMRMKFIIIRSYTPCFQDEFQSLSFEISCQCMSAEYEFAYEWHFMFVRIVSVYYTTVLMQVLKVLLKSILNGNWVLLWLSQC